MHGDPRNSDALGYTAAQSAQTKARREHAEGKTAPSFLPPTKLTGQTLCFLSMGETVQVTVWIRLKLDRVFQPCFKN